MKTNNLKMTMPEYEIDFLITGYPIPKKGLASIKGLAKKFHRLSVLNFWLQWKWDEKELLKVPANEKFVLLTLLRLNFSEKRTQKKDIQ